MGDDFEVFVPTDEFQRYVYKPQMGMKPQAGELVPESENTTEPSAPLHDETVKLGPTMQDDELINKVYTGECITSFRQMLKRYNLHSSVGFLTNSSALLQLEMAAFPYLRGAVTGAIHRRALESAPYNYCNTVMLHWVTHCFSAWRGSIRWKAVPRGTQSINGTNGVRMDVSRFNAPETGLGSFIPYSKRTTAPLPAYPSENAAANSAVVTDITSAAFATNKPQPGTTGTAFTLSDVNPVLEWEVPFYSKGRHAPGKKEDWTSFIPYGGFALNVWSDASIHSTVDCYCAAGEDYVPYFWSGCPVVYYEPATPIPL